MALALLVGTAPAQARSLSAGRIAIVGDHPLRLHIQTSASVSPQVQVVPNPERLVIDLPNTTAGAGFHGFAVRKGEIRAVRTSIFSTWQPENWDAYAIRARSSSRITGRSIAGFRDA